MSWVAVAVGGSIVVGGAINYMGAQKSADAAQNAANAQAGVADRTRNDILGYADQYSRDVDRLAAATPQELSSLGRAFSSASSALDREEKLLNAIDPSLMEASNQALKLLRGETADINKPMTDMRQSQRMQLVNSLRSQYGPGAESSSIGQRTLQKFDMETNALFAQNQQNSLNQVFGIASTDLGGRSQRAIAGLEQVGQGYSSLQNRALTARMNTGSATLGALSGTSQQMIQAAGAPYVGAALQGEASSNFGNTIAGAGTTLGAAYLGGQAKAPAAGKK